MPKELTRVDVATALGRSERQVQRYVRRGDLHPNDKGLFDSDEVAELAAELQESSDDVTPEAALINAATAMARQAQSNTQCMVDLLAGPSARILEVLQAENQSLRTQRDTAVAESERWRSQQQSFELERQELEAERARQERKWNFAREQLGPVLRALVEQRFGPLPHKANGAVPATADKQDDGGLEDMVVLLLALPPDVVTRLDEMVGPQMATVVRRIRQHYGSEPKETPQ